MNNRFYLAHPLRMEAEVREAELKFEKETGFQLENPFWDEMKFNPEREQLLEIKNGTRKPNFFKDKEFAKVIVDRDLKLIEHCDGLLAIVDVEKKSIGTLMELFYAKRTLQRKVYVITKTMKEHPFILALSDEIFESWEEFTKFMKGKDGW